MARELTGPKYLREFKCIGPDCEDSCCVEWTVPVQEDDYQRMKKAMRKTPADRAKLKQSIQRDKSARDSTTKITIKTPNDRCAFLDEDCLCSLQKRFGEQVLPQTCVMFPRVVRRVGETLEMGASMACPEAARMCLLDPEGAALVPLSMDRIPGATGQHYTRIVIKPEGLYKQAYPLIQDALYMFLSASDLRVAQRLSLATLFAAQTRSFFYEGCSGDGEEFLGQTVQHFLRPEVQRELVTGKDEEMQASLMALGVVMAFVLGRGAEIRKQDRAPDRFEMLMRRVYASYLREAAQIPGKAKSSQADVSAEEMLVFYQARKARLRETWGSRLEQMLENYCKNRIFEKPYVGCEDLSVFFQYLAVEVAVVSFILHSHPDLHPPAGASSGGEFAVDQSSFDKSAIEVFQTFAKHIGNDERYETVIQQSAERFMSTPAHVILLFNL